MRSFSFIFLLALAAVVSSAQQPATSDPGPAFAKSAPPLSEDSQLSVNERALACPPKAEGQAEQPGVHKVGVSISPPRPLHQVAANFSNEARKAIRKQHLKDFHAVSLLSMVVDANGNPQDICVQKFAGFSLDQQAVKAAGLYRFQPAAKSDGPPVAVQIAIEVNFQLY